MDAIELFAGAGGLAFGTAEAGIRHKVVVEWDDNACNTLRQNHSAGVRHVKDWKIVEDDVANFDFRPYADKANVIVGGPPCQPFSLGGKHRGHEDRRNLFPQAVRAVREIRPKAFIFENVKGLLRRQFANYYSYIIHQLRYPSVPPIGDEDWQHHLARLERLHTSGAKVDTQYNVVYQVVNAVNYGVPQHRWRVFIVGVRADQGIEYSFPQPTHEENGLVFAKWVSGEYWDEHRIPASKRPSLSLENERRVAQLAGILPNALQPRWRTVRDAVSDLPRIGEGQRSKKIANHFLNPGARSYAGHTGSPYDEERLHQLRADLEAYKGLPVVPCPDCLQWLLFADASSRAVHCPFCGYRRQGEIAARDWVSVVERLRPSKDDSLPIEHCPECGAQACVKSPSDHDGDRNFICLSCGHVADYWRCESCGSLTDIAGPCPDCVARALGNDNQHGTRITGGSRLI